MKRLWALSLFLVAVLPMTAQEPAVKVITGVTVIDGAGGPPIANASIVMDGGRIRQVGPRNTIANPAGAAVVDAQGKFVIPGLADVHNHLQNGALQPQQNLQANLGQLVAVGVTTIFDPSISTADFSRLKAVAADEGSSYARFFGTGPMVTVKGDQFGEGGPTPETPEQARAVIQEMKKAGVDAIKVQRDDLSWTSTRRMTPMALEVFSALVAEAHQQGLKVFVHAPVLRFAKEALAAGADGLMHGIIDEPVDSAFIELMKKNRAVYVPTLGLFENIADVTAFAKRQAPLWDRAGLQPAAIYEPFTSGGAARIFASFLDNSAFTKAHLPVLRANVKRVHDAGVPVVLGTDTGFFGVFVGVSTHLELQLLVETGLTPSQALQAATVNAARMIGQEKELGTIAAGKRADLVILDADPLADIGNTTRISRVMKGGRWYEPETAARRAATSPGN